MMIRFRCTECGKALKADERTVGQKAKCNACGATFVVPRVDSSNRPPPAHTEAPASSLTPSLVAPPAMPSPGAPSGRAPVTRAAKKERPPILIWVVVALGVAFLGAFGFWAVNNIRDEAVAKAEAEAKTHVDAAKVWLDSGELSEADNIRGTLQVLLEKPAASDDAKEIGALLKRVDKRVKQLQDKQSYAEALDRLNAGKLAEAKTKFAEYLKNNQGTHREEARALLDSISRVNSDEYAQQTLRSLSENELTRFEAEGALPKSAAPQHEALAAALEQRVRLLLPAEKQHRENQKIAAAEEAARQRAEEERRQTQLERERELKERHVAKVVSTTGGHEGAVNCVVVLPDGVSALSAGEDGVIRLWDLNARREIREFTNHKEAVNDLSVMPGDKLFASASDDRTIRVWNWETGEQLHRLVGHSSEVFCVSFSPKGRYVASGSRSDFRVWDLTTEREVLTEGFAKGFGAGGTGAFLAVRFSPDGEYLFTGSTQHNGFASVFTMRDASDGHGAIWRCSDWTREQNLLGHAGAVVDSAWSPDGEFGVTVGGDRLRLWRASNGSPVRVSKKQTGRVICVEYAPKDEFLITGGLDGKVRLWDAKTVSLLKEFDGQCGSVSTVALSPDARHALIGGKDGSIRYWKLPDPSTFERPPGIEESDVVVFEGDGLQLLLVGFTKDSKFAVSASFVPNKNTARVTAHYWDVEGGFNAKSVRSEFNGQPKTISSNGKYLLSRVRAFGGGFEVIDLEAEKKLGQLPRTKVTYTGGCAYSPDGTKMVMVASRPNPTQVGQNCFLVWDTSKSTYRVDYNEKLSAAIHATNERPVAISSDAKTILFAPFGNEKMLYRWQSDGSVYEMRGHTAAINGLVISDDGKYALTGSNDKTVFLWDVDTGRAKFELDGHNGGVNAVALGPGGHLAVSGGSDKTVCIWDLVKGQLLKKLTGHEGKVNCVAFAPNGRWVASGSQDGTVRVWKVPLRDSSP